MKTRYRFILISISVLLMLSSCATTKKIKYLQYAGMSDKSNITQADPSISITSPQYKLMPNDILFIRVITPDPQWSEIFNVASAGQSGSLTGESASLLGYPVDDNGYIEIPFVEKVKVGGKTLSETKAELDRVFKNSDAGEVPPYKGPDKHIRSPCDGRRYDGLRKPAESSDYKTITLWSYS
jgi:polysaccharide export outer membrane protein